MEGTQAFVLFAVGVIFGTVSGALTFRRPLRIKDTTVVVNVTAAARNDTIADAVHDAVHDAMRRIGQEPGSSDMMPR